MASLPTALSGMSEVDRTRLIARQEHERASHAHAQDEALSAFLAFREMWFLVAAQAVAGTVAASLLLCRVRGLSLIHI